MLLLLGQTQFVHVFAQDLSAGTDTTSGRYYELGWGTMPNTESVSRNTLSITSFAFDKINGKLHNSKIDNVFFRSVNFLVIQFYLGSFLFATIPHEFSGHYLRAREYGIKPGFHINFPKFGGFVPFNVTYNEASAEARMTISAGGAEVSATTGYLATQEFYSGNRVPEYYGWYILNSKVFDGYLHSSSLNYFTENPTQYFEDFRDELTENPSRIDDAVGYVLTLGESYGLYDALLPKDSLWVYKPPNPDNYLNDFVIDQNQRFKRAYLIQLLDPALISSLYGIFRYLAKGGLEYQPFMFKLKDMTFMPSVRANMGLIGVENYFDFFMRYQNLPPFNIYYRTGGNMLDQVHGGGFAIRRINVTKSLELSIQADYWFNERTSKNNYNIHTSFNYSVQDKLNLILGYGYKTKGSLMGKPIKEGMYGSFGLGRRL